MGNILAILSAAVELAPVLESAIPTFTALFKGTPPVSSVDITAALAALGSAAAAVPALAPIIPIVQKQAGGQQLDDTDLETLESVADAIDALVVVKAAAVEGT